MNEYESCVLDCKFGMKTYQNILSSAKYFERLITLIESKDHIVISSIFQAAVIRYAKPFLNTQTSIGKFKYPIKVLKGIKAFSKSMHNHLLELRNTLVAHDDFEQIEPHLLKFGIKYGDISILIPTSIAVANKCLSHPSDIESITNMKNHVEGVLNGVGQKLKNDIGKYRQLTLDNPESAIEDAPYRKNYGRVHLPKGRSILSPPNFMDDEWLNIQEPDFSDVNNGYHYERMVFRRDFHGPEIIELPGGYKITFNPNEKNNANQSLEKDAP